MTYNFGEVYLRSVLHSNSHYQIITFIHRLPLHTTPLQTFHSIPKTIIMSSTDAPIDDDYKSRTGQSAIPVQSDTAAVEATEYDNGGDSEQQLGTLHISLLPTSSLTQHREGREGCY
jgi:hypothetical protein